MGGSVHEETKEEEMIEVISIALICGGLGLALGYYFGMSYEVDRIKRARAFDKRVRAIIAEEMKR